MKKILIVLASLLILTIACTSKQENKISSLKEYTDKIDYSCNVDTDCEVKDIRNCCGYFPRCTSKDYNPNPELVAELCIKEGTASICGFEEITSCQCVNNKCESKT